MKKVELAAGDINAIKRLSPQPRCTSLLENWRNQLVDTPHDADRKKNCMLVFAGQQNLCTPFVSDT